MDNNSAGGGFPPGQLFLGRDGKVFGPYTREQIDAMRVNGEIAQYHWIWDGSGQWVSASLPPPPPPAAPGKDATPVVVASTPVDSSMHPSFDEIEDETTEITAGHLVGELEVDLSQSEIAAPPKRTAPPLFNRQNTPMATPPAQPPKGMKMAPPKAPPPKQTPPKHPPVVPPPRAVETKTPAPTVASRDLASIRALCFDRKRVINGTLARASADGCVFSLRLGIHPEKSSFVPGRPIWLNLVDDATGRSENVRAVMTSGSRQNGKLELKLKWERLPALLTGQAQAMAGR